MTERPPIKEPRDTLLLSHANPEDNEFTLWLALQLANEGYSVWCDLTKLLGGEVFWDDIEEADQNPRGQGALRSLPNIECQGRPAQGTAFRAGCGQKGKTEGLRHSAAHRRSAARRHHHRNHPHQHSADSRIPGARDLPSCWKNSRKTTFPRTRNSTERRSTSGGARSSAPSRDCGRSPRSICPTGFRSDAAHPYLLPFALAKEHRRGGSALRRFRIRQCRTGSSLITFAEAVGL